MKLKDMITVRTGLLVTRKVAREDSAYIYSQLTLKSFRPQCSLDITELAEFKSSSVLDQRYLTQIGDVIMRLTWPYTAVLIDESTSGIVVSTNFLILRQEQEVFYPEYLYWLMNSKGIKRELERGATSEMMGGVRPQMIGELPIHPIPMEQQRKIGTLYALSAKEQLLLQQLQQEKLKYNQWAIETAQRNMRKEFKL